MHGIPKQGERGRVSFKDDMSKRILMGCFLFMIIFIYAYLTIKTTKSRKKEMQIKIRHAALQGWSYDEKNDVWSSTRTKDRPPDWDFRIDEHGVRW